MVYDLGLDSLEKYKAEGKNSVTLKLITSIDLEHAYDGQEPEDLSFDSKGNMWFMDGRRNLYKSDFNANKYRLNKNIAYNPINITDTDLTDNNVLRRIAQGAGYFIKNIYESIQKSFPQINEDEFTNLVNYESTSGIDGIEGQVYDYLLEKGVPAVGAAAIMGNIQGESNFRTDAVNNLGCSGICQWYQGRLDNLKKLAASRGKDWTDLECQLDYLWEELNTKYPKVKEAIMNADQEDELEYATWYWGRYFEIFFSNSNSFEDSKHMTAKRYEYAQHWYQEWKQKHTNKSTINLSSENDYLAEDTLAYACSWIGLIPYKSVANGYADNEERFLPLQEGRGSDCSHFIHWVFSHVGLMEGTRDYFDKHGHSEQWGKGGDDGGCPGTVKIGTDLSKASPGDVLWWHYGEKEKNHVAIYLGNGKIIQCAYTGKNETSGVMISNVSQNSGFDQILHFKDMPYDPTGYFDLETMTLYSSVSKSRNNSLTLPIFQGVINQNGSSQNETENITSVSFEKFKEKLWSGKTIAIFDSEGTHSEFLKAINAKGTKGEKGGTTLYAKGGSTPRYWYEKFKNDDKFLNGKEYILVEVGPNDLGDWASMEKLLDLLVAKRKKGAKIYFEQVESTSGGSRSAIDAFNNHLKEYQETHEGCYYIVTRETPYNLKDENGNVKAELCDAEGLHFKGGVGAYEKWAIDTANAIWEREKEEIDIMGVKINKNNPLYDFFKAVTDTPTVLDWVQ